MAELCITDADTISDDDDISVLTVMRVERVADQPWSVGSQDYVPIDILHKDREHGGTRTFFYASKEHVRQLAETFTRLHKNWDKT